MSQISVQYKNFKGERFWFTWPEDNFKVTPAGLLVAAADHSEVFIPWHMVDVITSDERGLIERVLFPRVMGYAAGGPVGRGRNEDQPPSVRHFPAPAERDYIQQQHAGDDAARNPGQNVECPVADNRRHQWLKTGDGPQSAEYFRCSACGGTMVD